MEKKTKVKESDLPQDWSLDSADFINKLIMKSNLNRLGYYGAKEIKSHSWMKGVNWKKFE
jgi:protein kinase A